MRNVLLALASALIFLPFASNGQDDLMAMIDKDQQPTVQYTDATFKTTRIVIGQSVELPPKGELLFIVTHHFGALNTGYENLFGLNKAYIRLGLEYGVTKWMGIGAGLNTEKNTWDGFVKFKVLRQSSGARVMPVTVDLFANTAIQTKKWEIPERKNEFSHRMSYAFQLLIARKFCSAFSLQIMPAMVHKNLVKTNEDKNTLFTLGAGGRLKVSDRVTINAEYHHLFKDQVVSTKTYDSFSLGVDIDTGGHIFQIFLTNSYGEYEQLFLTDTRGKWSNGDIFLGFNINRIFSIAD